MTPEMRIQVVTEAAHWLRTPYHPHARVRGVGVDCAQFPAAVYEAVGLIEHIDPKYTRDWHLHRSEEQYVDWVLRVGGREIEEADALPGDMILWRWGRTFSHGAIIIAMPLVIHAWLDLGVTLDEVSSHEELRTRERRFFTIGGV